jgi:hypothetical protein
MNAVSLIPGSQLVTAGKLAIRSGRRFRKAGRMRTKKRAIPERRFSGRKSQVEQSPEQHTMPTTIKKPSYKIGASDGGPGRWARETTPVKGGDYQRQVTGAPKNIEYVVDAPFTQSGKIKFDGYNPERNVLVDAKDWDKWPPLDQDWAIKDVVSSAKKQGTFASLTKVKVEWHVPGKEKATVLRKLFKKNNIKGINLVVNSKK